MEKFYDIVDLPKQLEQHQQFIEGDEAIGRTALGSKFHIFAQQNNFSYETEEDEFLNLPHNESKEGVALGKLENRGGKSIGSLLKQWINTAVDNPTELNLKRLNAGLDTINVWLFLTMAGTPIETINYFMNQPIIKDYLNNRKKYTSHIAKATDNFKSKDATIKETLESYGYKFKKDDPLLKSINRELTLSDLSSPTKTEGKLQVKRYSDQHQILSDFIRYEEMAGHIVQAEQALSYDNNSIGKNPTELLLKTLNTLEILENTPIVNLDKAIGVEKSIKEVKKEIEKPKLDLNEDITSVISKVAKTLRDKDRVILTPHQQEALEKIRKFIKDPNKTFGTLKGRGGTGKTTIIKEIVRDLPESSFCLSISVNSASI